MSSLFIGGLMVFCAFAPELVKAQELPPVDDFPGKIPIELDFWDIVLQPDEHSWEDLDEYFRNELPKYEGKHFYDNLESVIFSHLIDQFELDKKADTETVEFYVQRLHKRNFLSHPEGYVRCLKRLYDEGYTPRQLAPYTIGVYDRWMENIAYMDNLNEYLLNHGHKFNPLKEFEEKLKDRLNIQEH